MTIDRAIANFVQKHSLGLSILGGGILGSAAGLGLLSLATGTSMTALPILQAMQAAAGGFAVGGMLGGGLCTYLSQKKVKPLPEQPTHEDDPKLLEQRKLAQQCGTKVLPEGYVKKMFEDVMQNPDTASHAESIKQVSRAAAKQKNGQASTVAQYQEPLQFAMVDGDKESGVEELRAWLEKEGLR